MKFIDGHCYLIRFHDHYLHGDEPVICETVGWVIRQDETYLYLTWWALDHKCKETVKNNLETYGLVKSTIISRKSFPHARKVKL